MRKTPALAFEVRRRPKHIVLGKIDGFSCFISFTRFLHVSPTCVAIQKFSEMMRETNTIKDSTGRITTYAYNSNVDLTSISNTNNEQTGFGKNSSFSSLFLEKIQ